MVYQLEIRLYGIPYLKKNLLLLSCAFAKNTAEIQLQKVVTYIKNK